MARKSPKSRRQPAVRRAPAVGAAPRGDAVGAGSPPARPATGSRPAPGRPAVREVVATSHEDLAAAYSYVRRDLTRTVVVAAALFAVIIASSFVIH